MRCIVPMRCCCRAFKSFFCLFALSALAATAQTKAPAPLRAPATPLVNHDPYFSVWSMADKLTDVPTRHWTGVEQAMNGIVRVDGKNYRFLGAPGRRRQPIPALQEVSHTITPTRTIVVMNNPEIELRVEFMTPVFPDDMKVMARPVTYLTWTAKSRDGRPHDVELYFDAAGTLATNDP